ncbi:MFS transporter [Massilia endophytica]|uniref:MFS transporter n=1 Tax=Massilia endophytica TaxID=2899220 RepID=UPI001E5308C7|nr:MFS transporter [Massilia endophytica]UGQ49146.1 MFS transporter [Massilia endophytica]
MPLTMAALAAILLWLLLGDLSIAVRDRAALPSAVELLRSHGASDTMTSLLLSTVPALLNMFLVPLVGYHSDRCRSRWGRRKPFLLMAAPVGGLAMLGLSASPALAAWTDAALGAFSPGARACRLAFFCLFWTVFECAALSALSLFTGLVNDIVPQGLLGRFFAGFRVVSLSVGIAFNTWVFALTDQFLPEILAGIGLVFGLPMLAMCLLVKETPLPPDAAPAPEPERRRFPLAHVLECFRYKPYAWAVAAFMLASVTFSPFNTFYQYYAHVMGIPKSTLGALTAAGYAVSIFSALGVGWLADRFGALRVSSVIMAVYCVVASVGYMGLTDAASFRAFYLLHVIISGAYFTAAASMPMALLPRSKFVQHNSTKDLMVMLGTILVSSVQGPMLDFSGHDYRLTLLAGAMFSLLCIVCLGRLQTGVLAAQVARRQ